MTKTIRVERLRGRIDFAIITILEEEFEAVLKRFLPRHSVIGGREFYEYCPVTTQDGRPAAVAMVRTPDQGQSIAQSVARNVIDDLNPRWLVLTGIAGGVPATEFSLGDVLLASSLHDLSITAMVQDEQPQFRPAGGPVHPMVARLLGILPAWRDKLGKWNDESALGQKKPALAIPNNIQAPCYYGADATREAVRNSLQCHFPTTGVIRPPLFRIGAVATSNVLLKDSSLLKEWKRAARHITHIEMEAGGVYVAARQAQPHELPLLCVRGISDIVGFNRDSAWTQFACESAASFLYALISSVPREFFDPAQSASRFRVRTLDMPVAIQRCINIPIATFRKAAAAVQNAIAYGGAPSIDVIVKAFDTSSKYLLSQVVPPSDRLPRPELSTLEAFLKDEDQGVLCVCGAPGSGKTAILALAAQNARENGAAVLAIKADMLPSELAFESWGKRELALDISALDAVRVVSSRSRVVVVVDQLDALASSVDLRSDRLNAVLEFITQCSTIPRVSVVCSCRSFDYNHDSRFRHLHALVIELGLPSWGDVANQLQRRGIPDPTGWPEEFQNLLLTPQHLQVYLARFEATGRTDPVLSYHLMLDDLWARLVAPVAEQALLDELTDYLIEMEGLWAPLVRFERHNTAIASLQSKQILQSEARRIGFRHQTLLEHAKARRFTTSGHSFSSYVLARQDAILVRPTVWAVLRYLREADETKYRVELEGLFAADLRLHLRYLLIEFLGQLEAPTEYEIALLAERLSNNEDRVRVLISIRGNARWFHALRVTHFPNLMHGPAEEQWPLLGIITDAWKYAREACLGLIEEYWIPDSSKDPYAWRALAELNEWDARALRIVDSLLGRTDIGERFWFERVVTAISANNPELAPRVFFQYAGRYLGAAVDNSNVSSRRRSSPLESTDGWYDLADVAKGAPLEFLREGWPWLVQVCEQCHRGQESTVVREYAGWCYSLDKDEDRPQAPILSAFLAAIDEVARGAPEHFVDITQPSWLSSNAVVHRIVVRGLQSLAPARPDLALQYLLGDSRRLELGSRESWQQSDSIDLIALMAPLLGSQDLELLEKSILTWSLYRDEVEMTADRQTEDRKGRLRLLSAIPEELLSTGTAQFVGKERIALPDWDEQRTVFRSGFVREIPPMSMKDMLTSPNEVVISAIEASRTSDRSRREWVPAEGGWNAAGGPWEAGIEISELAKEYPERAVELTRELVAKGIEDAADRASHGLADTSLTNDQVFDFVRDVALLKPRTEALRSTLGNLLYRRCKERVGLPDDLCDLLRDWLANPAEPRTNSVEPSFAEDNEVDPKSVESVLWSRDMQIVDADQAFWPLLAVTNGYLMRSPADTKSWLETIEEMLECDISERTWAHYCSELRWIRLKGCDRGRGAALVESLFRQLPELRGQPEGCRLIAHVSDLLTRVFVEDFLGHIRSSAKKSDRQAYGELLALIAIRDVNHPWAMERLNQELEVGKNSVGRDEAISIGLAFASAHMWDEPRARATASRVLSRLFPNATQRVALAISTVFWAKDDFSLDEATEVLLQAFADNPLQVPDLSFMDLAEHLAALLPHKRLLVLRVCQSILKVATSSNMLFEAGPQLLEISMTLQRFSDTRAGGLSLLEDLLRRGLDNAFRVLRDIDIQPFPQLPPEFRHRRRRRKH